MLSAIKDQEQVEIAEPIRQQIIRVDKVIATAQIEMRALLLHLRPIGLEDRSLKQGIEQLLLELQTKIPTTIVWDLADVRLESGIEDHLFRIVQEAISNTLRHARANRLEVYLQVDESSAQLKIVDDGLGFDMDKADKVGSYGLTLIFENGWPILGANVRFSVWQVRGLFWISPCLLDFKEVSRWLRYY